MRGVMGLNKKSRLYIRVLILSILVMTIVYTIYSNLTKEGNAVLKVGDDAPDFTLTDLNGNQHTLSEYKGQGVFINFWGTWCKPCEKEMPAMERQYQIYRDKGVQILAVNIAQSDFEVKKYAKQRSLTFPFVIDKTKSVMGAYNIQHLPTTILVNPEGKIVRIITGEMTEEDIAGFMESIKPS